jgi:hypothetical protein
LADDFSDEVIINNLPLVDLVCPDEQATADWPSHILLNKARTPKFAQAVLTDITPLRIITLTKKN